MARLSDVPADVEEARRLALDLEAGDPTFDHYTTDGSDAALWAVVLICILCVIVACGLAVIVVQIARHWRGAIEVGAFIGIGALVVRACWRRSR